MSDYREVKTIQHEPGREQRIFTFKATQLILILLLIFESLVTLRIILKFLGANPESLFAVLLYGFTNIFLFPFNNLVPTPTFGNMVFEISSVIGMAFYALVGWAIERIVYLVFYRPKSPVITEHTEVAEHVPPPPPLEVRRTTIIDHTPRKELNDDTAQNIVMRRRE